MRMNYSTTKEAAYVNCTSAYLLNVWSPHIQFNEHSTQPNTLFELTFQMFSTDDTSPNPCIPVLRKYFISPAKSIIATMYLNPPTSHNHCWISRPRRDKTTAPSGSRRGRRKHASSRGAAALYSALGEKQSREEGEKRRQRRKNTHTQPRRDCTRDEIMRDHAAEAWRSTTFRAVIR